MITPLFGRLMAGVVASLVALVLLAPQAQGGTPPPDPATAATTALSTESVYLSASAQAYGAKFDPSAGPLPAAVRVAVLTADAGNAGKLAADIASRLSSSLTGTLTVGVIIVSASGLDAFDAVSNADYCAGGADLAAQRALSATSSGAQLPDVQALLAKFTTELAALPAGDSASSCTASSSGSSGGSATPWLWLLAAAIVGLGGIAAFAMYSRASTRHHVDAARAEITPLFERLAADVDGLDGGPDPAARQALTDAGQRLRTVRDQLAADGNAADYGQVRHALIEGLTAAEFVRATTGKAPGPALPSLVDDRHDQLIAAQQVSVQDETFDGSPQYVPGAPYYFGGGGGVPGGWYATPFWRTLLLSGVLTGSYEDAGGDESYTAAVDGADQ